jgi:hypothetical protein
MNRSILLLAVAIASFHSFASAQHASTAPPITSGSRDDRGGGEQADGPELTHEGFMLRMTAGLALLGAGIEPDDSVGLGAGGVGQALSLSVGGYLVRNFALHADLIAASSENARTASDEPGPSADADHFRLGGVGMGLTYYLPYDLSLTGSFMLGEMSVKTEAGTKYGTDYALFGKLGVAKQWAVSDSWGLGIGATALAGTGQGESSDDESFDTGFGALSVDFAATYD